MSAFYAVCYDDRIEILTDGAIYDAEGTLLRTKRKIWTAEGMPMAVTGCGNAGAIENVARTLVALSFLGSFDAAMANINAGLARRTVQCGPQDPWMLVIAGISESQGPRLFYMSTANIHGFDDFEPMRLYDVGIEIGVGTGLSAEEAQAMDVDTIENGLGAFGAEFFEVMRRKKTKNPAYPERPEIHGIGGHVDWTVLRAEGARTTRLRTWDDPIGLPIDPFRSLAEERDMTTPIKPMRTVQPIDFENGVASA